MYRRRFEGDSGMIVVKDGSIYHDEHNCTVKVSNDNTKHLKTVTVILRTDASPDEAMKTANKLYKEYQD